MTLTKIFNNSIKGKIIIILIVLFVHNLNAQDTFEPGYILTTSNDLIKGYILDSNDSDMSFQISFKKELSDTISTSYTTNNLLEFGFNTSRIFKRRKYKTHGKTMQDSAYVFAKRIIKGKIDLYVWHNDVDISEDYFVVNNQTNRKAHLTKPIKREVEIEGKKYNVKDRNFKNRIFYVKNDIRIGSKEFKNLKYREKSIKNNILSYNKKYEDDFSIQNYKEPTGYDYAVLLSPYISTKDLIISVKLLTYKSYTEKSTRFSYFAGINYVYYSDRGNWKSSQNGNVNYMTNTISITPIGIRIQSKSKKIIPYGYIGLRGGITSLSNYIIEDSLKTGSTKVTHFNYGLDFGIGVKYKIKNNFVLFEINTTGLNIGYIF